MTTTPSEQQPPAAATEPPAAPTDQQQPPPAAPVPEAPAGEQPVEEEGGRYYTITDAGDPGPWALVRMRPRGVYDMWTGTEWVDMPFFASYFVGGEMGAAEIEEAEAEALKATIRRPPPGAVAMMRGDDQRVGGDEAPAPEEEPDAEEEPDEEEPADEKPEEEPKKAPPFTSKTKPDDEQE